MLSIFILIPGLKEEELHLQHLMLDFNGTLAMASMINKWFSVLRSVL